MSFAGLLFILMPLIAMAMGYAAMRLSHREVVRLDEERRQRSR